MTIKAANPYLFFNGKAEEAVKLYERALGGKVEALQRYGDVDKSCSEANKARVLHALVRVGDACFMLSDASTEEPTPTDSNVHVALDFDNSAEMARAFEALAANGTVKVKIHDTFWGAEFGMLIDAYGIHWMFNHTKKPA